MRAQWSPAGSSRTGSSRSPARSSSWRRITDRRSTEKAGTARSAGLLVVRRAPQLEVLIGHMGGPFWARREQRAYSIPKGGLEAGEDDLAAALREFREETGLALPQPPYTPLGEVRQRSGKIVTAFAAIGDPDLSEFVPAMVTTAIRGREIVVPELDRLLWATPEQAAELLIAAQAAFLDRLP